MKPGTQRVSSAPSGPAVQVSVVVHAYGAEPYVRTSVGSILASVDEGGEAVDLKLILVDNGGRRGRTWPGPPMTIITSANNLGFAAGCNAGVGQAHGQDLVFVNSDASVAPDANHVLTSALRTERRHRSLRPFTGPTNLT